MKNLEFEYDKNNKVEVILRDFQIIAENFYDNAILGKVHPEYLKGWHECCNVVYYAIIKLIEKHMNE